MNAHAPHDAKDPTDPFDRKANLVQLYTMALEEISGTLPEDQLALVKERLENDPLFQQIYLDTQIMNQLLEKDAQAVAPEPDFEQRMVASVRQKLNDEAAAWEALKNETPWQSFLALGKLVRETFRRQSWMDNAQTILTTVIIMCVLILIGVAVVGQRVNPTFASIHQPLTTAINSGPTEADFKNQHAVADIQSTPTPSNGVTLGRPVDAKPAPDLAKPLVMKAFPLMVPADDARKAGFSAPAPASSDTAEPDPSRKLIRNAALDLEVKAFAPAVEQISALTKQAGGYVDTKNSQRGGNGKLQGTLVVKVLPRQLDAFLAQLQTLGDVKNQSLATDDVTKNYYDTAARLKNAQRMEDQLAELLKKENGKVRDLLDVERELGRVRGEIETMQGQLKLYDFQVEYATVTISLAEKDLSQAAAYLLKEQDSLTLFAVDTEGAFQQARKITESLNGQILSANINRNSPEDISGEISALVPPEQIETFLAQIKALGRVDNLVRNTQCIAQDGGESTSPADETRTEKAKVQVQLSLRFDDQPPVQQTVLSLITTEIDAKSQQIKENARKVGAQVKSSSFTRQSDGTEIAQITLKMPMSLYAPQLELLKAMGRVETFNVQRQDRPELQLPDTAGMVEIALTLHNQGDLVPENSGFFATVRDTLGQGFQALFTSIKTIGIIVAFLLPWAIVIGLIAWIARRIYIWQIGRK